MERGRATKRAREVARLILENESCTTTDLEALGYKHSPRAVRDLREAGIDVVTEMETYQDPGTGQSKRRARYRIVGIDETRVSRRPLAKRIATEVKRSGKCESCGATGTLQVDHRVPFEIAGESYPHRVEALMPLCPSCNRTKSWICESCPNWEDKDVEVCRNCRWASPSVYEHVATKPVREIRAVLHDPKVIELFDKYDPDLKSIVENWLFSQTREID